MMQVDEPEVRVTEPEGVELVHIPEGSFLMGSPESEKGRRKSEGPQHEVKVPAFWMGRYVVTNEQYGSFLEAHPDANQPQFWRDGQYNQAQQPVVGVSGEEARQFAEWVGGRLPSEAEWEYAVRAGTTEPYLSGSTRQDLDRHGWYDQNSDGRLHPDAMRTDNASSFVPTRSEPTTTTTSSATKPTSAN